MAASLPIVSTNVGGIPELIDHGNTGILVESGNKLSFVEALVSLINNKTKYWNAIGKNAERYAINNFSINNIAKKYAVIYKELICKP